MVKLKISFEPRLNAHKSVHCFAGVPDFRSEKAGYEIVSKVKVREDIPLVGVLFRKLGR